jgi:hypothetical protein
MNIIEMNYFFPISVLTLLYRYLTVWCGQDFGEEHEAYNVVLQHVKAQ